MPVEGEGRGTSVTVIDRPFPAFALIPRSKSPNCFNALEEMMLVFKSCLSVWVMSGAVACIVFLSRLSCLQRRPGLLPEVLAASDRQRLCQVDSGDTRSFFFHGPWPACLAIGHGRF